MSNEQHYLLELELEHVNNERVIEVETMFYLIILICIINMLFFNAD